MIRHLSAAAALLLAGTACSAQQNAPVATGPQGPQPAGADRPVPRNSPLEPDIRNVPATTGRANLAPTPPPAVVAEIGRFDSPFAMAFLPDGRLLVTEKGGTLKGYVAGNVFTLAGVPKVAVGGQGGLLDIAISPNFARSHELYLSFAEPRPNGSALALARMVLVEPGPMCDVPPCPPQVASLGNVAVIWRAGSDGPGGQFGAKITFSPDGNYLFLTSGERQRFTPAQDPEQLLGKIVRLTLDGRAAPGNPFADRGPVQAQVWTSGHRNPYGLVFATDGRLWEDEMGPMGGDELNLIEPGRNYGWPIVSNGDNYSGQPIPDHPSRPDFAEPALWWNPSISPGGMIQYTGTLFPRLKGMLLIAALSGEGVAVVRPEGGRATPVAFWDMGTRIRDIAQAPDGSIWLLEDGERGAGGRLLRLTPKG